MCRAAWSNVPLPMLHHPTLAATSHMGAKSLSTKHRYAMPQNRLSPWQPEEHNWCNFRGTC